MIDSAALLVALLASTPAVESTHVEDAVALTSHVENAWALGSLGVVGGLPAPEALSPGISPVAEARVGYGFRPRGLPLAASLRVAAALGEGPTGRSIQIVDPVLAISAPALLRDRGFGLSATPTLSLGVPLPAVGPMLEVQAALRVELRREQFRLGAWVSGGRSTHLGPLSGTMLADGGIQCLDSDCRLARFPDLWSTRTSLAAEYLPIDRLAIGFGAAISTVYRPTFADEYSSRSGAADFEHVAIRRPDVRFSLRYGPFDWIGAGVSVSDDGGIVSSSHRRLPFVHSQVLESMRVSVQLWLRTDPNLDLGWVEPLSGP